jgi:hypothetical protein
LFAVYEQSFESAKCIAKKEDYKQPKAAEKSETLLVIIKI